VPALNRPDLRAGDARIPPRLRAALGWRVVEIGCGVGLVSFWMAEQGASVVAVDSNQAQIEVAAKYAREQGIANLEFHVADA
jgi:2-polyprenyl-3-methyl-5-hydroxy-6-metoxy-1,4-benzoquinol methylase